MTNATNSSVAGVHGTSNGAGGVGVRGDGSTGVYGLSTTGVGVTGEATAGGYGVYAKSVNGTALAVDGNAIQNRDKGGLVKALLFVDPFVASSQYIQRCYNGVFNLSSSSPGNPNCGFTATRTGVGGYAIDLGYLADDRFVSITTNDIGKYRGIFCNAYTSDQPAVANVVFLDCHDGPTVQDRVDVRFYLTVY